MITTLTLVGIAKSPKRTLWWKEVINDVTNGLERRDEDGGQKLEILRLVIVGGNMATASLDTAPVGEVDIGNELEDDEEACYHLIS
jgi:hypothetical protein